MASIRNKRPELKIKNVKLANRDFRGSRYDNNRSFLVTLTPEVAKSLGYFDDEENYGWGTRGLDHLVQDLQNENWPVRYYGESDQAYLSEKIANGEYPDAWISCKVKYHNDPEMARLNPSVYLTIGNNVTKLTEESIGVLDSTDVDHANIKLQLAHWTYGKEGTRGFREGYTAYVSSLNVVGIEDNDYLADDDFAYGPDFEPSEDMPF